MLRYLEIVPSAEPRSRLLQWINATMPAEAPNGHRSPMINRVEDCGRGVPYALLLPFMLPVIYSPLLTDKVKVPSKTDYDAATNLRLVEEALRRNGIPLPEVLLQGSQKLIHGNFQANLQMLQWFRGLHLALQQHGIEAGEGRVTVEMPTEEFDEVLQERRSRRDRLSGRASSLAWNPNANDMSASPAVRRVERQIEVEGDAAVAAAVAVLNESRSRARSSGSGSSFAIADGSSARSERLRRHPQRFSERALSWHRSDASSPEEKGQSIYLHSTLASHSVPEVRKSERWLIHHNTAISPHAQRSSMKVGSTFPQHAMRHSQQSWRDDARPATEQRGSALPPQLRASEPPQIGTGAVCNFFPNGQCSNARLASGAVAGAPLNPDAVTATSAVTPVATAFARSTRSRSRSPCGADSHPRASAVAPVRPTSFPGEEEEGKEDVEEMAVGEEPEREGMNAPVPVVAVVSSVPSPPAGAPVALDVAQLEVDRTFYFDKLCAIELLADTTEAQLTVAGTFPGTEAKAEIMRLLNAIRGVLYAES